MPFQITTAKRKQVDPILHRFDVLLHDNRGFDIEELENELYQLWELSHSEIRQFFVDLLERQLAYREVAAYYAEHSNYLMAMNLREFYLEPVEAMCVLTEFQKPLAELYGAEPWYSEETRQLRKEWWEFVFKYSPPFGASQL